jgi:hypothetical protein
MDLPWLQAVQDKAVQKTGNLEEEAGKAQAAGAGAAAAQAAQPAQPAQPGQQAQQPAGEARPAEQAPAQQPNAGENKGEPPPPWVVGILEPSAAQAGPEQSYEPEELSHIMPWAHSQEAQGAAQALEPTPTSPGLPPWLGDVTVQETLSALPPSEQKVTEPVEVDLEGIEPFVPPVEEVPEAPQPDQQPDQVPAWLRDLQGASQPAVEAQQQATTPGGTSAQQASLAGLTTNAFGGPTTRDVPVRPPRAGAVETLALLMQPAAPDASRRTIPGNEFMPAGRAEVEPRRGGWRSWLMPDGLIYLLVLAVLLTVLIVEPPFGEVPAPAASGVIEFYNAVESVPAGKPVLVVYDWDASRSGEMTLLAQVVMHHIMERKLPFATVSTVPQGPGFAQQITDQMLAAPGANYGYNYGREYLVLGYLPGNEAALRSLVTDFEGTLPLDYVNSKRLDSYSLVQGGSISKLEDFGLIVDLASSEAELRNWIEQVASRTNVPIVAAVSQGLEPFARPYLGVPGARLSAVISGVEGANQYTRQLELAGKGGGALNATADLNTRLNAQSVAALFVGLVIVGAFVTFGTRRIMRR